MGFPRPDLSARSESHALSPSAEPVAPTLLPAHHTDTPASVMSSPSDVAETARLIAAGEEQFTGSLPPESRDSFVDAARKELLGFIARQIAIAIQRHRDEILHRIDHEGT